MVQPFDAIVLAGGGSTRLGRNKLDEELGPRSVLQNLVASLETANMIVVVGTPATVDLAKLLRATEHTDENLILVSEHPPGSGPAMAIAAGARALAETTPDFPPDHATLVIGGDMPFAASAIPDLLAALTETDIAVLTDSSNQPQYLASAWHRQTLLTATATTTPGDSARSLFIHLDFQAVRDHTNASQDIDTEEDLTKAQARLNERKANPEGTVEHPSPDTN